MDIELCVASFEEAELAQKYQLTRIELCSALEVGGLTPSFGMIEKCAQLKGIETHIMIRPRAGNFACSADEVQVMLADIKAAAKAGAHGVVFGSLTPDREPDLASLEALSETAKSFRLEATFHRAFDFVRDPSETLEQLIGIGFDRVLTSGQKDQAEDGAALISSLVKQSNGRIQVMAGSGIHAGNVSLFEQAGVDAVHFTAHKKQNANQDLSMGYNYIPDPDKIESILKELHRNG